MGVITLKLSDEVERKLRRRAAEVKGARRGALAESVEEAVMVWLEKSETPVERRYVAMQKERRIAEEPSLNQLSKALAKIGIDPRTVLIEEIPRRDEERRMGLRTSSVSR